MKSLGTKLSDGMSSVRDGLTRWTRLLELDLARGIEFETLQREGWTLAATLKEERERSARIVISNFGVQFEFALGELQHRVAAAMVANYSICHNHAHTKWNTIYLSVCLRRSRRCCLATVWRRAISPLNSIKSVRPFFPLQSL